MDISSEENFDLEKIYKSRRQKVYSYMKENSIDVAIFSDNEDCRDHSLRYLTGHPSDALAILAASGKCILIPWDINLAKEKAHAEEIIPSTNFDRSDLKAIKECLKKIDFSSSKKIAFPPATTYVNFEKFKIELNDFNLECKEDSIHSHVKKLRSVKDEYEIFSTRKACAITDLMTQIIVENVKKGIFKYECDAALFAEKFLRENNAECTSFDTLCAGPDRSWAIHAFPSYTNAKWGSKGLSILDYGVCVNGYASDCTITLARDINAGQRKMLDLVQKAADECAKLYKKDSAICEAAKKADEIFAEEGMKMPHSLGHGTGLDIHEAPFIRVKNEDTFQAGNIVTLEPGLYEKDLGGCRLENDLLITDCGNEILTHSKIFYL